ncbi:MAG: creatininase family protein [Anaerolineae bacterium]|nr:creatininase family protein [Anaerolineae bacterium]
MHFGDLNWMDIESYLEQDGRVILAVGSTEQHGYLSLLSDVRIPMALANAAVKHEQVLIAPPLNFGISPHFMTFPGTISLAEETFHRVLYDIALSLVQHGFDGVLILNGHGGNTWPPQFDALQAEVEDLYIAWYEWFRSPAALAFAEAKGLAIGHANWAEAFAFNRVGDLPGAGKPPLEVTGEALRYDPRGLLGDGSFGGPYRVDDATMDRLFELLVNEVVEILREM